MAWSIFITACCFIVLHAQGAPRTAVYNFVKCQPQGNDPNCVTQQSPPMEWSPDLPKKLPPSSASFLDALPVEDEGSTGTFEMERELLEPVDFSGSGSGDSGGPVWDPAFLFPTDEWELDSDKSWIEEGRLALERAEANGLWDMFEMLREHPPLGEDQLYEV
ncbi:serglycin [Stigmatopora nigra]